MATEPVFMVSVGELTFTHFLCRQAFPSEWLQAQHDLEQK